jgi:hypothetical protein
MVTAFFIVMGLLYLLAATGLLFLLAAGCSPAQRTDTAAAGE